MQIKLTTHTRRYFVLPHRKHVQYLNLFPIASFIHSFARIGIENVNFYNVAHTHTHKKLKLIRGEVSGWNDGGLLLDNNTTRVV